MSTEKTFNALGLQLIKFSLPHGETLVFISYLDFWHSSLEHYGQLVEPRISGLFAFDLPHTMRLHCRDSKGWTPYLI